ncbi:MAG: hypothetical protein JSS50_04165 [Proteobacteria bacterium]|nr:hypothetical protein [Pseudomonadota bacterium]
MASKGEKSSDRGELEGKSGKSDITGATASAAEKIGTKLHESGVQSVGKADPSYSFSPPTTGKDVSQERGRG